MHTLSNPRHQPVDLDDDPDLRLEDADDDLCVDSMFNEILTADIADRVRENGARKAP